MKIAFIVNKFPALSETFILNQITGLMDMGHQVEIFAQLPSTETKVQGDVAKYNLLNHTHYCAAIPKNKMLQRIKTLFLITMNFFRAPMKVTKALKILLFRSEEFSYPHLYFVFMFLGKKYDIIHAHFGPAGNTGLVVKQACTKAKLIVTFHGFDVNRVSAGQGSKIYHNLFRKGDIFTANTNFTKQQVLNMGCQEEKIKILPVGLKIENFEFHIRKVSSEKVIRILTVARLTEKKGIEYAIRAIADVVKRHNKVIYTIAGDGTLNNSLQALVAELNLEKHIEFTGALVQEDVIKVYRSAHIFVLPSVTAADGDKEGQGLVLQEAQACGLPVISTLHNGIPEGVIDGKSAFLVPEKDVDALAEKLEYLITHPELWSQMGIAGREYVQKSYDIKILNQKLVEIYRSIL